MEPHDLLFTLWTSLFAYVWGMVLSLGAVNWWRKRRGYRTTVDQAYEED